MPKQYLFLLLVVVFTLGNILAKAQNAREHLETGNRYFAQGQFEAAIGQFTAALAQKPDLVATLNNRSLSKNNLKQFAAVPDFNQALKLNPKNVHTIITVARPKPV